MANEVEILLNKFSSLDGENLQQKQRSFTVYVKYVKKKLGDKEDAKNIFVDAIIPKNDIEKIFKIDLLLQLQRNSQILEILQENELCFIRRIIKDWTFLKGFFQNIDIYHFVQKIMPRMCYYVKLKIINAFSKVCKSESKANEFYTVLEKQYGRDTAIPMLPACSLEFIKNKVENCRLLLRANHFFRIIKTHRDFAEFYLKFILKHHKKTIKIEEFYKHPIKYIMRQNCSIILSILEELKYEGRLGKRALNRMYTSHGEVILDRTKSMKIFKAKHLYSLLLQKNKIDTFLLSFSSGNLEKFKEECVPESHDNFQLIFGCNPKPKCSTYELISEIFKRKFNEDIVNYPQCFTEYLLEITPLPQRERVLDIFVKENKDFIYLYSKDKAISVGWNLFENSDTKLRVYYTQLFYKICKYYKDEKGLLQMLQNINEKHRNNIQLIKDFFLILCDWEGLERLDRTYWELIESLEMRLTRARCDYFKISLYISKHLYHMFENQLPVNDYVKVIISEDAPTENYEITLYKKKHLEEFAKILDVLQDNEKVYKYQIHCFKMMTLYNEGNPSDPINLLDYKHVLISCKKYCGMSFIYRYYTRNYYGEEVNKIFWEHFRLLNDDDMIVWYAQNRPDKVLENIDTIREYYTTPEYINKYFKRIADHMTDEYLKKVIKYLEKDISNSDYKKVIFAIRALSVINPHRLKNTREEFLLELEKIHGYNSKHFWSIKQTALQCLFSVVDITKDSKFLLDNIEYVYSNKSFGRLWNLLQRTQEIHLQQIFSLLYSSKTKIRKQAILLSTKLLNVQEVLNIFKKFDSKENNLSVKNKYIRCIVKYFIKNPNESFLDLLRESIKLNYELYEDLKDYSLINFLVNAKAIPLDQQCKYIPLLFNILNQKFNLESRKHRNELIESIAMEALNYFSEDFLKVIAKETLFHTIRLLDNYGYWSCISDSDDDEEYEKCYPNLETRELYWEAVFHTNERKSNNAFNLIFDKFRAYAKNNNHNLHKTVSARKIRRFVTSFCKYAIRDRNHEYLVRKFYKKWTSILKPEICLDYWQADLLLLYFESNFCMGEFSKKLFHFMDKCVAKFNTAVIPIFSKQILLFFKALTWKTPNIRDLFVKDHINMDNERILIAIIYLLPDSFDNMYGKNDIYSEVLKVLMNCSIPIVRFHFSHYRYKTINTIITDEYD